MKPQLIPTAEEMATMLQIANLLAKSGYYQGVANTEQAFAKILRGWGLGITPAESLEAIATVSGKLTMTANLMATLIQRAGYQWEIVLDDTGCELKIYNKHGQFVGVSAFTIEDATKAELNTGANKNTWRKFPRNMLFARAISNAAKWYCPDAFGGAPVYTPDELGAEVNEDGEIIDTPKATPANGMPLAQPAPAPNSDVPAELSSTEPRTAKQNAAIHGLYAELYPELTDEHRTITRRQHVRLATGGEKDSSALLTEGEATRFIYALETLKLAFGYYGKPIWEQTKETEVCQRLGKDSLFELAYSDLVTFHHYLLDKLSERNAHA